MPFLHGYRFRLIHSLVVPVEHFLQIRPNEVKVDCCLSFVTFNVEIGFFDKEKRMTFIDSVAFANT